MIFVIIGSLNIIISTRGLSESGLGKVGNLPIKLRDAGLFLMKIREAEWKITVDFKDDIGKLLRNKM